MLLDSGCYLHCCVSLCTVVVRPEFTVYYSCRFSMYNELKAHLLLLLQLLSLLYYLIQGAIYNANGCCTSLCTCVVMPLFKMPLSTVAASLYTVS
jgi:hypothetical protein